MPWPTSEDVAVRMGRDLTVAEEAQADQLLEGVISEIALVAGKDDEWAAELDPVPGVLKMLAIEVVQRTIVNPESVDSSTESLGAYSRTERFTSSTGEGEGIFLSDDERRLVRAVVGGATSGTAIMACLLDELPEWGYPRIPFPLDVSAEDEEWVPPLPS